jgi:hypothetical protein
METSFIRLRYPCSCRCQQREVVILTPSAKAPSCPGENPGATYTSQSNDGLDPRLRAHLIEFDSAIHSPVVR